jgi:hypothetical protein
LPLLSGLVLPTPSGTLALSDWLPIGRARVFVGLEFPTLLGLGVWELTVWAELALTWRRRGWHWRCRYVGLHHSLKHFHHLLKLLFLIRLQGHRYLGNDEGGGFGFVDLAHSFISREIGNSMAGGFCSCFVVLVSISE